MFLAPLETDEIRRFKNGAAVIYRSRDGGATWKQLATYDGSSGGYVQKTYDLSAYAGKQISFRFRYASDGGVHKLGAFVDELVATPTEDPATDWPARAADAATPVAAPVGTTADQPVPAAASAAPRASVSPARSASGFQPISRRISSGVAPMALKPARLWSLRLFDNLRPSGARMRR